MALRRATVDLLNDLDLPRPDFLRNVALPAEHLHLRGRIVQTGEHMFHATMEGPTLYLEGYLVYLLIAQPINGSVCAIVRTTIAAYSLGNSILLTVPVRADLEREEDFDRVDGEYSPDLLRALVRRPDTDETPESPNGDN